MLSSYRLRIDGRCWLTFACLVNDCCSSAVRQTCSGAVRRTSKQYDRPQAAAYILAGPAPCSPEWCTSVRVRSYTAVAHTTATRVVPPSSRPRPVKPREQWTAPPCLSVSPFSSWQSLPANCSLSGSGFFSPMRFLIRLCRHTFSFS